MEPGAPAVGRVDTAIDTTPLHRRSVAEMLGETFREAGILLAVFIPLDLFVQGQPLTRWSIVAIVVLPLTLLGLGIGLERWRRQ